MKATEEDGWPLLKLRRGISSSNLLACCRREAKLVLACFACCQAPGANPAADMFVFFFDSWAIVVEVGGELDCESAAIGVSFLAAHLFLVVLVSH